MQIAEIRICFREAKHAATAGSAGPNPIQPLRSLLWQLNPLLFLAFSCILLHGADSASSLPFSMPHEADSAAILPFMLLYEADYDAMLHYFCHMKPIMLPFCFLEPSLFNENPRMNNARPILLTF